MPMGDYAPSHDRTTHVARRASASTVGWILLASVLCGVGLFLLAYFLVFFAWWSFSGAVMVVAGVIIFFRTWTGPESA